jgi:hypothetical protein
MDCLNSALMIAIQCGVTGIAWGTTGVAKTAFFEALFTALGYDYFKGFIPSMHMPEDLGGIPDIDKKSGTVTMRHMDWLHQYTKPKGMLVLDEVTTAPQPMRPPLLSIMNERRVGNLVFHPSTIIVAIANPPEMAPNSSPLEASMCNRLYHHDWETPFDSWLEGMKNGGNFPLPTGFPIVGDYSTYLPKWTRIIGYLCQRHPAIRETRTIPDGERAFPSLRQWFNLAKCLAGADKVKAGGEVVGQLATGMVGTAASGMLLKYLAARDLYDPADVVDRKVSIDYTGDRVDQLIFLPVGIMETLADDHSAKRMDNAVETLVEMGENGMLDCVGPVLSDLTNTYSKYTVPKKLLTRYGKLVAQIGGNT